MLYYAVIAVTTLHLNRYIHDPDTTMWVVLAAMVIVPMIIRAFRKPQRTEPQPEVQDL